MSTNSTISLQNADGTVRSIYCHWDGYPSYNGRILVNNYNTIEKVEALIALGDLSVLAESPELPEWHSFNNPIKGYCVAYGRDRGDSNTEAKVYESSELRRYDDSLKTYLWGGFEYNYLFKNGEWYVTEGNDFNSTVKVINYEEVNG